MRRRQILSAGLAAVGCAATGLPPSRRSDPLRVGSGEHSYECVHDWGELPSRIQYGLTHGIAVDRRNFVHVLHTSRPESPSQDTVVVFDPQGRFVRSWGAAYAGSAHGFDLIEEDGREVFYITDQKRGLFKTTLDGEVLWHVPKPVEFYEGPGKDLKYSPSNVAVAPTGDVYLSDGYGSYFIHRLDRNGRYVGTFGGPGQVTHPHGLYVDTRGSEPLLVVAENNPGRLQALTLDGRHHSFIDVSVRSPRHFGVGDGLVALPDLDARVTLLDEHNRVIAHLGDGWTTKAQIRALRLQTRDHFIPGKFVCPHDAAFDDQGNIYIAEWVTVGRITKLQKI